MLLVAHHLQTQVPHRSADEKDTFARSAFNRYYYATFLNVRAMLKSVDKKWHTPDHAQCPNVLRGQVKSRISAIEKKAKRVGDKETENLCQSAKHSLHELAEILERSNEVRKIADYEPEIAITFPENGRFCLNGVDITEAHDWPQRTEMFTKKILAVLRSDYG